MWNTLDLKCPEKDVCTYKITNRLIINELPNLVSSLTSFAEILTEDHPIWTEIKVFKNVQTKYSRILHCDKCLLLLQRVGSCLRKMVLLNLSKCYLDLAEHLLFGMQSQSPEITLPSRQQLEFVLIRTQAAAKLMCEALRYSRQTFCYLLQRLRVGHLVLHLMMATSITARINIWFKGLLLRIFDAYRELYTWHSKLKRGNFEWPQPLNLPKDLESWLQPEESELFRPKLLPQDQMDFLTNFFEKKTNENPESDNDSIIVEVGSGSRDSDDDDDSVVECSSQEIPMEISNDFGEVISRNGNSSNPEIIAEEISIIDSPTNSLSVPEAVSKNNSSSKTISKNNSSSKAISKNQKVVELTKSQKLLLSRITKAPNLKKLKSIWVNLNTKRQSLLPRSLAVKKVLEIDRMFAEVKSKIISLKKLNLSDQDTARRRKKIIKTAATRLVKHIGLARQYKYYLTELATKLKPVKTFKGLKELYHSLYIRLQADQQYGKCRKLKRVFKSRKEDINLLIQTNEKNIAKKLIFCTSKVFLTRFQIQVGV